ncbi:nuclease Le1 [Crepidotus variabilis]|uniref:Nuclease Le1 n=1 Tax=Crepidotus variabilis TaxID=179855 RepID=A0A9P6JX84_9AGAR|nr:nuclease Le1 [Crepidotus variabilis]
MKCTTCILGLVALSIPGVYGWGATGHQTVGQVAMSFLGPKALAFVKSSLGSTYNQSLSVAATWADDVRSQTAYKWSSPLHYVDAEDNPPTTCDVSFSRDCADGMCILSAIANYTQRVVTTSLGAQQQQEALKFLTHFIGDIGQPLHVEAIATGGNDISVTCAGKTSNLHSTWDTGLITQYLSVNFQGSMTSWASSLVSRIQTSDYKSQASSWISCSSTTSPLSSRSTISIGDDIANFLNPQDSATITPLACPEVWANESNKYDCSTVFSYTSGQDLCATSSAYYAKAIPVIELQIAKQGYRLAAWLNVLFDGATDLP